jgi:hypothetical protein
MFALYFVFNRGFGAETFASVLGHVASVTGLLLSLSAPPYVAGRLIKRHGAIAGLFVAIPLFALNFTPLAREYLADPDQLLHMTYQLGSASFSVAGLLVGTFTGWLGERWSLLRPPNNLLDRSRP